MWLLFYSSHNYIHSKLSENEAPAHTKAPTTAMQYCTNGCGPVEVTVLNPLDTTIVDISEIGEIVQLHQT